MDFSITLIFLFIALANGDTCLKPSVSDSSYTTRDRQLSDDTAFIVKFKLGCTNNVKDLILYADINGRQYPVTKSPEGNVYQLSWVTEHSKSPSGTYTVRFFDEEGVNGLRKAIRNEDDTSGIKSLFDIDVKHPGISRDLWLTSEAVGLMCAGLIYYSVCRLRSEVMNS